MIMGMITYSMSFFDNTLKGFWVFCNIFPYTEKGSFNSLLLEYI